jgi:methionyl-tRNA synthetase
MKIKLGEKHILNSDQFQFWITVEMQSKSGNPYERICTGYHKDFRGAIEDFIDRNVKGSDSTSYKKLFKEVEELKKEVRGWKIDLEREKETGE